VVASFHSRCSLRNFLLKEGVFLYRFALYFVHFRRFRHISGCRVLRLALRLRARASDAALRYLESVGSGAKFVLASMPVIVIDRLEPHRDAAAVTVLRWHMSWPQRSLGSGLRAINPE
jgi:hypothetical protein